MDKIFFVPIYMNVRRWLKLRRPAWEKLDELVVLIDRRGGASLSRQQLQEFGRLYRAVSADLSRVRVLKLDSEIETYLNNLVVKAHNQVYQTDNNRWRDLFDFLWCGFPSLVRQYSAYIGLAAMIFALALTLSYAYVQKDIHFAQLEISPGQPLVPDELWHTIEQHKMWTDPAQKMSPIASTAIAINNIRATLLAFVLGITFGFGTTLVLIQNGLFIGTILGVCRTYGMDERLLAFVAPHGVLELTAVFVSGGAGFMLAKALLFPGKWRRVDALKLAAKDALGLFAGSIPMLALAGLIEGFISPRTDLHPNYKFAISAATVALLMAYFFVPRNKQVRQKN